MTKPGKSIAKPKMTSAKSARKAVSSTYAFNKKVGFDYEIMDKYECGIELNGAEVKSIRTNQAALLGAHVSIRGGEAYLIGADFAPFQKNNIPEGYDAKRNRRLLLNKSQIAELAVIDAKKGLTIVPVSMYNKGTKIKIEIAVVRGKKKFDKRQTIKERDSDREVRREFSDR